MLETINYEKLRKYQIEIMDELHRICTNNSITYYIIGGTLLGAIRHKGYIPWDLDIDIALPREDYIKFKKTCQIELNEKYKFYDYTNVKKIHHAHGLLCNINTELYTKMDKYNIGFENLGIYIDVFPLDNAPDDEKLRKKQENMLKKIKKIKKYKLAFNYSNNIIKKVIKKIISLGLFFYSYNKINEKEQNIMQIYNNEETLCYCSMASHYSYGKQCMDKKIYGTPILLDFEDRKYYAPEKYKEYLERIYNNYMALPSLEQQKQNLEIFDRVVFDKNV